MERPVCGYSLQLASADLIFVRFSNLSNEQTALYITLTVYTVLYIMGNNVHNITSWTRLKNITSPSSTFNCYYAPIVY